MKDVGFTARRTLGEHESSFYIPSGPVIVIVEVEVEVTVAQVIGMLWLMVMLVMGIEWVMELV